jgi:plasmid stability protein
MATLYVENVPEELYDALRQRARTHRKSIASEVLSLLEENVPTAQELARRKAVLKRALQMRSRRPASSAPFPSAEEMLREDRAR